MSTATRFLYHRPFSFCPEHKTEAEIDAIANPGGNQRYLRVKGTLAQAMRHWWNAEQISESLSLFGTTRTFSGYFFDDFGAFPSTAATPPRDRACKTIGQIAVGEYLSSGGYGLWQAIAVYLNTTTSQYETIVEFYIADDVSPSEFYIHCWEAAIPTSVPFPCEFTIGDLSLTFTLYAESADTFIDEINIQLFTYA